MIFTNNGPVFSNGQVICDALAQFLKMNKDSFERSLIPDLSHIDSRAENINGIDVGEVTYLENDEYQLVYSYDWSVYRGCSDMDEYDECEESVVFTMDENGYIEFDLSHLSARNTIEEF
ncbi:conserved hypothetical protein [Vibrio crassostreae]|uniref:hypothetical protein n=1 Tax=Vibrio crassostreae TaxID=246167 RepID=UPI001B3053A6|nr:hypothetical protein [Vibrio crassostreae]CAK1816797.1 conserved hypothetical protein [Vibrio crassostreae]CAK1816962.1 conserved hypothetical protein [Vibrio crassostreae]CAK1878459.1 conserved hypothetical protein [Vibrio crassostreae]CAK1881005.1 conserved hypothetical protein [Vibrio crassostreae]CAK1890764.1 conserved hypothetical protein [Vibrio crassostreae]